MSENKTPRLAEILGVKVGQEFRIEGDDWLYRISRDGRREGRRDENYGWLECASEVTLIELINDPSLVHPVMQWTQDDVKDAKAVRRLYPDCEWVARDERAQRDDVVLFAYKTVPKRQSDYYSLGDVGEPHSYHALPCAALPSVTWENSPVRIADIFGDRE